MICAIRCSVKRRDLFESTQKHLNVSVPFPVLDIETRWSSTFNMVSSAYKAKRVFKKITDTAPDLKDYSITEAEWETCKSVCDFLGKAASLTEVQSGSTYSTLSMTIKAFRSLRSTCKTAIDSNDVNLRDIAVVMDNKLDKYSSLVCRELPILARILDPRFGNDIIDDSILLRRYVSISEPPTNNNSSRNTEQISESNSFIKSLLDEDSLQGIYEDEITMFLRNTSIGDRRADPLQWWKTNETRFPSISKLARSTLCINASSVASESAFSQAGLFVDDLRTRLSDENLCSSMLVKSWDRFMSKFTG